MESDVILVIVVGTALVFDFTNGFHDTANVVATSISTRAMAPRVAVGFAAILNFVGAFLSLAVAATVASGIVEADLVTPTVVFAGLVGAITWNLITWYFGLPSSSSQALIGGLVGAAVAGGALVHWKTIVDKVLIPMLASPVVGFCAAFAVMLSIMWIFRRRNPHRVYRGFRMMQTVSASALALGHGLQDAQKTMGVIFLALITTGHATEGERLPLWVVLTSAAAISAGTYAGGWRIMRTMGRKIIDLDPVLSHVGEAVQDHL